MDIRDISNKIRTLESECEDLLSQENYNKDTDLQVDGKLKQIRRLKDQLAEIKTLEEADGRNTTTGEGTEVLESVSGTKVIRYNDVRVKRDVTDGLRIGHIIRAALVKPVNEAERRALTVASDAGGGYTVDAKVMQAWVEKLRAKSVIFQLGAQLLDLEQGSGESFTMATQVTDPTLVYRSAENGEITESTPVFGSVTFSPKTVGAFCSASNELLQDSVNIVEILEDMFTQAFARDIDRVALSGASGSYEPTGIDNYTGLTETYVYNDSFDKDTSTSFAFPLLKVLGQLENANVNVNGIAINPEIMMEIFGVVDDNGQPAALPKVLTDLQWVRSSAVALATTPGSRTSTIYMGDWTKLVVGMRRSFSIRILTELKAQYYSTAFLGAMRYDIKPLNEANFGLITSVKQASAWS